MAQLRKIKTKYENKSVNYLIVRKDKNEPMLLMESLAFQKIRINEIVDLIEEDSFRIHLNEPKDVILSICSYINLNS